MFELIDMYKGYRRGKREPTELVSMIEAEGGDVLELRIISRLVPSPFAGLRVFPILYEFRVHYATRQGRWYVRTLGDGLLADWAWADDDGNDAPIVDRAFLTAAPDGRAVGWLADCLLIGGLIAVGVCAIVAIYLILF